MKRGVVATALAVLCLFFCFYTTYDFKSSLKEIAQISQSATSLFEQEKYDEFSDKANELKMQWEKKKDLIGIIVAHDETDDIELAVIEIPELIKNEDYEALNEKCVEIKNNAYHLISSEKVSFGNVL